jgi:hypothetical protein
MTGKARAPEYDSVDVDRRNAGKATCPHEALTGLSVQSGSLPERPGRASPLPAADTAGPEYSVSPYLVAV